MKFVKTAVAFGVLSAMSSLTFIAMDSDAHAQIRQLKPGSPTASVAHGRAPADGLARVLENRERTKKLKALQSNKRDRTKQMFQKRPRTFDLMHGNARNNLIRRTR